MKRRVFIKLNRILLLAFFVILFILLIVVNPFNAGIFVLILFYLVLFGLILSFLNLFKIPWWLRILISIAIIFILIVQSCRL